MQIKIWKNLKDVEKEYKDLYNNNKNLDEFQSFEYLNNRQKIMKFQHIVYRTKILYYGVYGDNSDDKLILILPVQIFNNCIKPLSTLDSLDILYNVNCSEEEIEKAFNLLLNIFDKPVIFENVTEFSKLYSLLLLNSNVEKIKETECGKIKFGNSHEEYFASLSKGNRQNIRTAYNRLDKDGKTFKFNCSFGLTDKKLYKVLRKNYIKRYQEKNGNASKLKKFLINFYEPISKLCAKSSNGFNAILYVNNEIAAFMSGFHNVNNNSIIIPRLAYNSKFSRYSSGVLLINETIKYLINNSKVEVLDLGIGNENYKYVMGADNYYAYHFKYEKKNDKNAEC